MPAKNVEKYIRECLDSILIQTEQKWELIAVDDSSTDNTYAILKEYQSKDDRINVIQNINSGIIPALQLAYQNSSGQFIHRMDADDIMVRDKLKKLKGVLINKGKGHLATAEVEYFAKGGVSDGYKKYQDWLNTLCINDTHWQERYKECVIPSPCWMVYRSDFEKSGGFSSDVYPEDFDLIFRFYRQQLKVVSVKEVLHFWRDYSERTSRNHEHYRDNNFFKVKLMHFLIDDYDSAKELLIWGAGKNGKTLAKILQSKKIPFEWVSNNPNKHGKEIYQQLMQSFEVIIQRKQPQIIITVAQRNAKQEILAFLNQLKLQENKDYFFFR